MIFIQLVVVLVLTASFSPVFAQQTTTRAPSLELTELESPVTFDLASISGNLKETIQSGRELVWLLKGRPRDQAFKLTKISFGLLRSQIGDRIAGTFSADVVSFGFRTLDEASLHVIQRSQGGAALHTVSLSVLVECTGRVQTLHPQTTEFPAGIASTVFANARSIEIADHIGPNAPALKVQRCS